jgi:hypothetical protein
VIQTDRPPLRAFAQAFFSQFGAQLTTHPDELVVDLPPELASHFGKNRLYLVFPTAQGRGELSPHKDLLVYGSRTLDAMLAWLAHRGEVARLAYPPQVSVEFDPLPAPSLHRPRFGVAELAAQAADHWYYVFNIHLAGVSDSRDEAFFTTALDSGGQPAPAVAGWVDRLAPLPDAPAARPIPLAAMLKQAMAITRQAAAPLLEQWQQAARARLDKVLLRLKNFYRQRMDEVDTGDAAQDDAIRAELRQDLTETAAAELARHRLHVTLTPVSYALALIPAIHYRLSLVTILSPGFPTEDAPAGPPCPPPAGLRWEHYRWSRVRREHYTVYVGYHWRRGIAATALDHTGALIFTERSGWSRHFRG